MGGKTMDKLKHMLLFVIVIMIAMTGCHAFQDTRLTEIEEITETPQESFQKLPVSRSLAAKDVLLLKYTKEELKEMQSSAVFDDVSKESWYAPYISAAAGEGYMTGDGSNFRPLDPLTMEEADILLRRAFSDTFYGLKLTDQNRKKPVSMMAWEKLLRHSIENKERQPKSMELTIFALPSNAEIESWTVMTDQGKLGFGGIMLDSFCDKKVEATVIDGEILWLNRVVENQAIYHSALLYECDDKTVNVFWEGIYRQMSISEPISGTQAGDITVNNGAIQNIDFFEKDTFDKVYAYGDGILETEKGQFPAAEEIKVYRYMEDRPEVCTENDLIPAEQEGLIFSVGGTAELVVLFEKPLPTLMRVAIQTSDYEGFYHKNFSVTSLEEMTAILDGESILIPAEHTVTEQSFESFTEGKRLILSGNGLTLNSVSRANGSPCYKGSLEIVLKPEGYVIVNEVPMENYISSVTSAEMPESFGLEAAKVQAVTARSYGWNQFYENRFCQYGANVDDSTASQVYQNTKETDISKTAAQETAGQCILYDNSVISANFYSTSCGVTASSGEVWAKNGTFPSETLPYLASSKQFRGKNYTNFTDDATMYAYLTDPNVTGWDDKSPWFRWNCSIDAESFTERMEKELDGMAESAPQLIQVQKSKDKFGKLISMKVSKRGQGGNAMVLSVQWDGGSCEIATEYQIRKALCPDGKVQLSNNSAASTSMLPSGFFVLMPETNEQNQIQSIKVIGGGFGHGSGLSQYGTAKMAESGLDYKTIIEKYFAGAQVEKIF